MSTTRRHPYPFSVFEPKWQQHWDRAQTFHTPNPGDPGFDPARPKYYVLDMFPYPSGSGLHVGHPEGYTATDIISRYKRMRGFNVLHPMGWDAFGLPAEQYAIKTGQHPRKTTETNIATFKLPKNFHTILYEAMEIRKDDRTYPVLKSYAIRPSFTRLKETIACVNFIISMFNRIYSEAKH